MFLIKIYFSLQLAGEYYYRHRISVVGQIEYPEKLDIWLYIVDVSVKCKHLSFLNLFSS